MSPRPWGIWGVVVLLALAVPLGYFVISLLGALVTNPIGFVLLFSFVVGVSVAATVIAYTKLRERSIVMKVADLMSSNPVKCGILDSVQECASLMYHTNIGYLVVQDEHDQFVGVVSDRDLVCGAVAQGLDVRSTPVSAIMERDFVSISSDKTVSQALERMYEAGARRLPVIEEGRCVGVISVDDILAAEACSIEEVAPVFRRQLAEPRPRAVSKVA